MTSFVVVVRTICPDAKGCQQCQSGRLSAVDCLITVIIGANDASQNLNSPRTPFELCEGAFQEWVVGLLGRQPCSGGGW